MLDKMAAEYENGTWEGNLTKVTMGRPRISDEELTTVAFRLPKSRLSNIERISKSRGETRSQFLRDAVNKALVSASLE